MQTFMPIVEIYNCEYGLLLGLMKRLLNLPVQEQ